MLDFSNYSQLIHGECLEEMAKLPDNCVDLILTDPPYGTTACKWDSVIPLDKMWAQLSRVIKPKCAIVMTACQPFTTILISSNLLNYKYNWVWNKRAFSNQMMAKKQPLRVTEDVVVFNSGVYYPQGLVEVNKTTKQGSRVTDNIGGGSHPLIRADVLALAKQCSITSKRVAFRCVRRPLWNPKADTGSWTSERLLSARVAGFCATALAACCSTRG